jgi:putative transposase
MCLWFVLVMKQKGWHRRGYLPHFDVKGIVQHVVLCTKDALSQHVVEALSECDPTQRRRMADETLDRSRDGNLFCDATCAAAFEEQLLHFDGERYDVLAWCIMPNHIHVVMCMLGSETLGQVVRSWKVLTTSAINRHFATTGPVFAKDYFDRFMRNGSQTERTLFYVENNPVAAGFCVEPAQWRFSSAWYRASGWEPKTENLPLSLPML